MVKFHAENELQIKSSLFLLCSITLKRVTSWRRIVAPLCPGNTAHFEEMLQRWRAVGNTVSDSTSPRFESHTSPPETYALPLD